jgi:hypothetical protein
MQKPSKNYFKYRKNKFSFILIRGYNVTEITLTLDGTTAYPKVYQSLCTMLTKKALNPADMTSVKKRFLFLSIKFFLFFN